jgi:predicted RNase H-like HicB family nuclease
MIDRRSNSRQFPSMTLQVVIERGEDGYFVARCPSLKSCWSQGRSREEALENIREAIDLYLEPSPQDLIEDETREVVALSL